jgi:DNA-binding Lrp family transcriptional regulator
MSSESIIRSELLIFYNKGKSSAEAYKEISKSQFPYNISEKTVNKWFEIFKLEESDLDSKCKRGRKPKFTDEHLVNLIDDNPGITMKELAALVNASISTISKRVKNLNNNGKRLHFTRSKLKFTNESLINLINENPQYSMAELGELLGSSASTVSYRIKQIIDSGESINYIKKAKEHIKLNSLIDLIDDNPELNIRELAKLADTSEKSVSKKIKQINSIDGKVKYTNKTNQLHKELKDKKENPKLSDEYIIDLVNSNPLLNMTELAKLANTSPASISKKIKEINGKGKKVNYQYKYSETVDPKFTDEILINLIKEKPGVNAKELAKLTNTSISAISKRLRKINWIAASNV